MGGRRRAGWRAGRRSGWDALSGMVLSSQRARRGVHGAGKGKACLRIIKGVEEGKASAGRRRSARHVRFDFTGVGNVTCPAWLGVAWARGEENNMKAFWRTAWLASVIVACTTGCLQAAVCIPSLTNHRPLSPGAQLKGVTFDDVSNVSGELDLLANLPHMPIARIYFGPSAGASSYTIPIKTFFPKSYIMGEIADSSDMANFTLSSIGSWTNSLINTLGLCVDIWEVGNEINGDWLLNSGNNAAPTMAKMEAVYDAVTNPTNPTARSQLTALTFFYEGEPSNLNNCIATANGGNDMFTWIKTNFQTTPTAETEKIRKGLNYVLARIMQHRLADVV
jgi:hypothetical protein